jgi:peroxiredoxin
VVAAGAIAGILLVTLPRAGSDGAPFDHPVVERPAGDDAISVGSRIGQRAPDFTLRSLAGNPVSLSDHDGSVVILDFWASWCVPCQATFPTLHALWRSFADRGVVLIGVSLDRSKADADAYLAQTGFDDVIALWESYSAAAAVADRYGVSGIPNTIVIDRTGIVRYNGHPVRLTARHLEEILN